MEGQHAHTQGGCTLPFALACPPTRPHWLAVIKSMCWKQQSVALERIYTHERHCRTAENQQQQRQQQQLDCAAIEKPLCSLLLCFRYTKPDTICLCCAVQVQE